MDRFEEILVGLFTRMREELRDVPGVGLALKAQGRGVTLRVRSEGKADAEKRPFFAIVVGAAERDDALRVTYRPSGLPRAESRVTIVAADELDALLSLIRGYVERERRRLSDYHREG